MTWLDFFIVGLKVELPDDKVKIKALPDDRVKLFFSNGRVGFSDYRVGFSFSNGRFEFPYYMVKTKNS